MRYKIRYQIRHNMIYKIIYKKRNQKSDRLGISASDRSGNRRAGAGGTDADGSQLLPFKILYKNPLGNPVGYLVREQLENRNYRPPNHRRNASIEL